MHRIDTYTIEDTQKHIKIFIHYLSITAGIDRATTGKVNFNISACSQARKKIQTATGMFVGSA